MVPHHLHCISLKYIEQSPEDMPSERVQPRRPHLSLFWSRTRSLKVFTAPFDLVVCAHVFVRPCMPHWDDE